MDPIIERTFRDSPTWYARTGTDGAGDKTYASGVVIKCLIDGSCSFSIATIRPGARLGYESHGTGDYIKSQYIVYVNITKYDIKPGDELLIAGRRWPVLDVDNIPTCKNGQDTLGVLHL